MLKRIGIREFRDDATRHLAGDDVSDGVFASAAIPSSSRSTSVRAEPVVAMIRRNNAAL